MARKKRKRVSKFKASLIPAHIPVPVAAPLLNPATKLIINVTEALLGFAGETIRGSPIFQGATSLGLISEQDLHDLRAQIEKELGLNPDVDVEILVPSNERQKGRSEVIKAIANPPRS